MVLDNADDPIVFSYPCKARSNSDNGGLASGAVPLLTFLPQTPNGSILVTSRSQDAALRLIGSDDHIIKIKPMDENCALQLLEKKIQSKIDKDDAMELLRVLDYMPLAITQAAAYIRHRAPRTTVAKYLDHFRKSDKNQANLLNRDAGDLRRDGQASNSIIATWQISFEYIRNEWPSAARLLSLMSFFDRQGIPDFLLRSYDEKENYSDIDLRVKSDIDLEDDSEMKFEDDVCILTSYSLITTNVKGNHFEMHRLVQFSTRKWLELNIELEKWKKKYIKIILEAFSGSPQYEDWKIYRPLFPHAEAVLAYRPTEKEYLIHWSEVLATAAYYATTQGNYLKAEDMNSRALEEREKTLGKEHHSTLTSVSRLAETLQYQGKYDAAEAMCRRALDGFEKALGKEHPDTLTSVNNLALVLRNRGKYDAAEEMCRRALDGYEKTLGKEHPNTLTSISNLASVLQDQGKYDAAEEMCRRALDGFEKTLGKEHPETLTSVGNLA